MRFNHASIGALNLATSIAFYEMLGLTMILRTDAYARFIFPNGDATLSVNLRDRIATEDAPVLHFECEDLDGEVMRLKAAGIAFENDPAGTPWLAREAHVRDPAGNRLCLYFAGVNRVHPPGRIQGGAGAPIYHIIVLGFEGDLILVKRRNADYRTLQKEFPDYLTSVGPHALEDALQFIREEWPEFFMAQEQKIRAFAESNDTDLKLS